MRFEFAKKKAVALAVALAIGTAAHAANPDRDAYFGETHLHTSWSLDAWLFGNRITGPADAYKYFKGAPLTHPPPPRSGSHLRDQDRHAARLCGRHRPLRVRRRDQVRERSQLAGQQAAGRAAAEDRPRQTRGRRDAAHLRLRRQGADGRPPDQVARRTRRSPARSGRRPSRRPTRRTSPGSSPRSAPTSGRRCRTT